MRFRKDPAASLSHTDEGAFFQDTFHIKTVKQPPQIMRLYRDFSIFRIGKIRDPESTPLKELVVYDKSVFIPFQCFDLVFLFVREEKKSLLERIHMIGSFHQCDQTVHLFSHIYAFSKQIDLKPLRFISQIHILISSREIRIRMSGSVPAGNSSFRSLIWSWIIPPVFTGA